MKNIRKDLIHMISIYRAVKIQSLVSCQNSITVPALIVPAATIKGSEFFGAGSIRVTTLQILLTKIKKNIFLHFDMINK